MRVKKEWTPTPGKRVRPPEDWKRIMSSAGGETLHYEQSEQYGKGEKDEGV